MAYGNSMTICGNISSPELRFTNSGKPVCTFGVALNERRKDESGNWVDVDTSWIDVVAWDKMAENIASSIDKGDRVVVTGRYKTRSWEREDGTTAKASELVADEVGLSLRWAQVKEVFKPSSSGPREPVPTEAYEEQGAF